MSSLFYWAQISTHIENLYWFLQRKLDYKNTTKQISYYLYHSLSLNFLLAQIIQINQKPN